MKVINNKKTKVGGQETNYADLITTCVKAVDPQQGATIDEMRKAMKVLDVTEKAGEEMKFEDAEMSHIKEKVEAMKWAIMDRGIIQFVDDINDNS